MQKTLQSFLASCVLGIGIVACILWLCREHVGFWLARKEVEVILSETCSDPFENNILLTPCIPERSIIAEAFGSGAKTQQVETCGITLNMRIQPNTNPKVVSVNEDLLSVDIDGYHINMMRSELQSILNTNQNCSGSLSPNACHAVNRCLSVNRKTGFDLLSSIYDTSLTDIDDPLDYDEKYSALYRYALKCVLLPVVASNGVYTIDTGVMSGYMFGDIDKGGVFADVFFENAGVFVSMSIKNRDGRTSRFSETIMSFLRTLSSEKTSEP